MNTPSLSLNISGNKRSNEGFMPLVVVGTPHAVPDTTYPGFEANDVFYVVRNLADCTQFTLVRNGVSSYGASRMGSLRIAVSLPTGMTLAGGVSPLHVVRGAYELYEQHYLRAEGSGVQFTDLPEDPQLFAQFLTQFTLEPCERPCRPMTGTGRACVVASEAEAASLMLDTQYPEFVPYAEVVVAAVNYSTLPVLAVAVPRPLRYEVFVNGQNVGTVDMRSDRPLTIKIPAPSRAYEDTNYTIDLSQLRVTGYAGVEVHPREERIVCTLQPRQRVVHGVATVLDSADAPLTDLGRFFLRSDKGQTVPLRSDGGFTLSGEQLLETWRLRSSQEGERLDHVSDGRRPDGTPLITARLRPVITEKSQPGTAAPLYPNASPRQPALVGRQLLYAGIAAVCLLLAVSVGAYFLGRHMGKLAAQEQVVVDPEENPDGQTHADAPTKPSPEPNIPELYQARFEALSTTNFSFDRLEAWQGWIKTDDSVKSYEIINKLLLSQRIEMMLNLREAVTEKDATALTKALKNFSNVDSLKLTKAQSEIIDAYAAWLKNQKDPQALKGVEVKFGSFEALKKWCENKKNNAGDKSGDAQPAAGGTPTKQTSKPEESAVTSSTPAKNTEPESTASAS